MPRLQYNELFAAKQQHNVMDFCIRVVVVYDIITTQNNNNNSAINSLPFAVLRMKHCLPTKNNVQLLYILHALTDNVLLGKNFNRCLINNKSGSGNETKKKATLLDRTFRRESMLQIIIFYL